MTNGQIQQLQDLSKCLLPRRDLRFVAGWLFYSTESDRMTKEHKAILRRLTHQYCNQIRAIKKNQVIA